MTKVIFGVLLLPFIYLNLELFIFEVNDPIKYIYTLTGASAIVILFFTTTISLIKSYYNLMKFRRMIGLFGFFYAFLHFLNFIVLDGELDISFVYKETIDKPFIYLGMISFALLLFMAVTSTKELFRRFNNYHKVLYIVLILSTIHFIMAQKSLSIPQWGYLVIIAFILFFKFKQKLR